MHWVTVLILFLLLKKFFFEKIHNFIMARDSMIKDAFDNAEITNRKAEERLEAYNKRLSEIEAEGRDAIKQAKAKAEAQAKNILEDASAKAEEMLERAKIDIQREKDQAILDMREQIIAFSLMAAEKIIEKDLDAEGQDVFIDKLIEEAGRTEWRN
jgi:F-type H+-transporting ATPase subunit b